ncbi:MAG: hypothetical protein WCO89_04505, partial [Syntrophus sp. (in: bacteria)]
KRGGKYKPNCKMSKFKALKSLDSPLRVGKKTIQLRPLDYIIEGIDGLLRNRQRVTSRYINFTGFPELRE